MSLRRHFIARRPFSSLAILILLGVFATLWVWRVQLMAFPDIISAYTAKEYCSCRYVMNNPASYCLGYVKQWVSSNVTEHDADKTITATGMGRESSAQWRRPRQGCRLQSPAP